MAVFILAIVLLIVVVGALLYIFLVTGDEKRARAKAGEGNVAYCGGGFHQ